MELRHGEWSTVPQLRAAMRATTVIASATNIAADRLRLPNGGYGYLGVCNDSVAAVQAALGEEVTMYPCILAGRAKATMSRTYEVRAAAVAATSGQPSLEVSRKHLKVSTICEFFVPCC
jgi:hypothetical protein